MNKEFFNKCLEIEVYGPYRTAKCRLNFFDKLWCKYIAPHSNAIYMIRKMQLLNSRGKINRLIAKLIHTRLVTKYGITVHEKTKIGIGLSIPHPSSITICCCSIGKNLRILQNTTIGCKNGHGPKILDDVCIFAGATVIGGICVENGTVIGANACLLSDTKPNSVYAGVPAKQINTHS